MISIDPTAKAGRFVSAWPVTSQMATSAIEPAAAKRIRPRHHGRPTATAVTNSIAPEKTPTLSLPVQGRQRRRRPRRRPGPPDRPCAGSRSISASAASPRPPSTASTHSTNTNARAASNGGRNGYSRAVRRTTTPLPRAGRSAAPGGRAWPSGRSRGPRRRSPRGSRKRRRSASGPRGTRAGRT